MDLCCQYCFWTMEIKMAETDFDKYVDDYRDIINKVSSISGEQFEYFIQLRLSLMSERIGQKYSRSEPIRILDFGCGTGTTEKYLREFFPGALVYALDSSVESIYAAQEMCLGDVTFIHAEGNKLPFQDEYFDLVYSNGTYHHIQAAHQMNYIGEMFRVCRCGGDLFVFENNPLNPLMMRAMRKNPFDAGAIALYPHLLRKMAIRAGFACNEISYYFFFPRFLCYLRFLEKWLRRVPLGAQYFLWATKA
jgi:ubiquinone/menaquinone biosynthesis C-methylase UbiE